MEMCSHGDCGFEGRQEYCTTEAAEQDGAAGVVVDMLDALLYESGVVTSDESRLVTESEQQVFTRKFSYLQGDVKSWVWPLTETSVAICHTKDKQLDREMYQVAVTWHVEQIGIDPIYHVTTYGIDVYPEGPVQAFIEQPSMDVLNEAADDTRETRRMTEYDYEQLYNGLATVYDLHAAERSDNARVV